MATGGGGEPVAAQVRSVVVVRWLLVLLVTGLVTVRWSAVTHTARKECRALQGKCSRRVQRERDRARLRCCCCYR